ncbi:MAG: hypothetical protein Q8L48_16855 [Archangium sp.]|nr:hypothetical protein [Archangium sp.]
MNARALKTALSRARASHTLLSEARQDLGGLGQVSGLALVVLRDLQEQINRMAWLNRLAEGLLETRRIETQKHGKTGTGPARALTNRRRSH